MVFEYTSNLNNQLLKQTNPEDLPVNPSLIKRGKVLGTPITEEPSRKKPEVLHDPYWSMIHRSSNKGNTKPRIQTPDPTYMTISEVSSLLRVSPLTIKRWEKVEGEKKLHPIRINSRGDRRYLREEIQRFIGGI